jgi:hypothetical protein
MTKRYFLARYRIRYAVGTLLEGLCFMDHLSAGNSDLLDQGDKSFFVQGKKIFIYATYKGLVGDVWERKLLDELENLGFESIIVANGCASNTLLNGRKNLGYDLAAVRDITRRFVGEPLELLIMNSSVAWDMSMKNLIVQCRNHALSDPAQVIGMTESLQRRPLAQSYFFFAQEGGVRVLINAYAKMRNWRTKRASVTFGEMKLSESIRDEGIGIHYLLKYQILLSSCIQEPNCDSVVKMASDFGIYLNPTQHLWRAIFLNNFRFIKRNLVRNNPARMKTYPSSVDGAFSSFPFN